MDASLKAAVRVGALRVSTRFKAVAVQLLTTTFPEAKVTAKRSCAPITRLVGMALVRLIVTLAVVVLPAGAVTGTEKLS